jgi:hypothetical protein
MSKKPLYSVWIPKKENVERFRQYGYCTGANYSVVYSWIIALSTRDDPAGVDVYKLTSPGTGSSWCLIEAGLIHHYTLVKQFNTKQEFKKWFAEYYFAERL